MWIVPKHIASCTLPSLFCLILLFYALWCILFLSPQLVQQIEGLQICSLRTVLFQIYGRNHTKYNVFGEVLYNTITRTKVWKLGTRQKHIFDTFRILPIHSPLEALFLKHMKNYLWLTWHREKFALSLR